MAKNKLLNFRASDDLIDAIERYGVEHYPSQNSLGYDQSKTIRDILLAGLNSLDVRLEVKQKSDTSINVDTLMEQLEVKLATRYDQRLEMLEDALQKK